MATRRATHVRFQLSRELTWAEREALHELSEEILGYKVDKPGDVVHLFAHEDSRVLGDFFHHYLSVKFCNVYLKAIKTIYPRVKV